MLVQLPLQLIQLHLVTLVRRVGLLELRLVQSQLRVPLAQLQGQSLLLDLKLGEGSFILIHQLHQSVVLFIESVDGVFVPL